VEDASYQNDVIALHSARFAYADARAELSGAYVPDGKAELRATVRAPDLERVTAAFLPRAIPGALALEAQLTGSTDKPKIDLDARYRKGLLYGMQVQKIDVSAHADVPARTVALQVDGRAGGGSVHVDAKSKLARSQLSERALRDAEHDVEIALERIPLERLEMWPEGRFVPETAQLSGQLRLHGSIQELELQTKLASRMIFPGEREPVTLGVEGSYQPRALEIALDATDSHGPLLRTHMKTDLARDGVARDLPALQKLIVERSWDASLWVGARRVDQLPAFRALQAPEALWPAQVSAQVELEHKPGTEPKGVVQVKAVWDPPGLKGGELQCGLSRRPAFQFRADMAEGELKTQGSLAIEGRTLLALQTDSHAPIDEWFEADPKEVQPASLWVEISDLGLADVPVVCDVATGRLSGTVELKRALMREVTVSADLNAHQIQFGKSAPFEAVIDAHADRRAVLAHAKLSAADGSADIDANLPLDGGGRMPTIELDGPARADLVFRHMQAAALLAPVPAVRATAGTIDGKLELTGTLREPKLAGLVALDDVTATLGQAGQRFERVNGKIALNGRELHLYPTKLHDREGSMQVEGDLKMTDFNTWQAKLEAKADDFPVRRSGVMVARFGGKLDVEAKVDPAATELDVELSGARLELTGESLAGVQALDPHPDVVFVDGPPPEQKKPEPSSIPVVVRVKSKEPFWVRREDFSALVSTDLRIEVRNGQTNLSGPLEIQRGVVELLGQLFDIKSGKITFAGGHQVEPTLELTATRRVPGGSLVTIEATGTLYRPTLNFLVDGAPVTAGEALATATGASTGAGSDSSVQQELSSMALGIATGVLTVGARRELGEWVPVLAIEQGAGQTQLRAGVQADRFIPRFLRKIVVDAYVEGIFSTGGPESSASPGATQTADATSSQSSVQTQAGVLLELRFPKHLVGEAQYGPGERWSLDLNWQP
jgi:autotransporter translocation and assembly factor TamB